MGVTKARCSVVQLLGAEGDCRTVRRGPRSAAQVKLAANRLLSAVETPVQGMA
jgi:hypothetical protein